MRCELWGPKEQEGQVAAHHFLISCSAASHVSSKRYDADVLVGEWIETAKQREQVAGQEISAQDSELRKSESMSMSSGVSYARVLSQLLIPLSLFRSN